MFLKGMAVCETPPGWPPIGTAHQFKVTKDTCISSVGDEKNGNCGGWWKLKLKGQQEYILLDIDPTALKGKLITGAVLYLNTSISENTPVLRVGVSTVASSWREGFMAGYLPFPGASCFAQAGYKTKSWAYPGSNFMDAVFGNGHTIWGFADAGTESGGRQSVTVSPDVVSARVAGLSFGFALADEVGSEWRCRNGRFSRRLFPNRFVYSSEHWNKKPWMKIWVNGEDHIPPNQIIKVQSSCEGLPPGRATVKWKTPADKGGGKTLGFNVRYEVGGMVKDIPRYLIPMAGKTGREVVMHIRDLALPPGKNIRLFIQAVDSAGNAGAVSTAIFQSAPLKAFSFVAQSKNALKAENKITSDPVASEISIIDLFDKINPETGKSITEKPDGYMEHSHIFNLAEKTIQIQSGRNETVCFQVVFKNETQLKNIRFEFSGNPEIITSIYKAGYVEVAKGSKKSVKLPDPLILLKSNHAHIKKNHSLICELFVPHEAMAGLKQGRLLISGMGMRTTGFDVLLNVYDFTLPDKLSFVPEMNAYDTANPFKGYEYYRLAHEHRTCLNRLPYRWDGNPAFAPGINGQGFDWATWDDKIGPLLDGTAFNDMKRAGEPVDVLYLPFNENWPISIFEHFTPSYWAEDAFDTEYRGMLGKSFKTFGEHFCQMGWFETVFQFYLNNKVAYRLKDPFSSAPWHFDEPVNPQDFWALRWYGKLWQHSVSQVCDPRLKMWFRADISYSEFGRNILWGVTDVEYLGGNNRQKTRMMHDRRILNGPIHFWEYGSANKISETNLKTVLWCLSAWFKGADGVLPWQTIGAPQSRERADQNAIFYPHPDGPMPSLRLKAFMSGQQIVEYCTIASQLYGTSRNDLKRIFDEMVKDNKNKVDTGLIWRFKTRLGEMISAKTPTYRRSWYNWADSKGPKSGPVDLKYVSPSPDVPSIPPDCDRFSPYVKHL